MAIERQNSAGYGGTGNSPIGGQETVGATRNVTNTQLQRQDDSNASDLAHAAAAKRLAKQGDPVSARAEINQINDPGLRVTLNSTFLSDDPSQVIPPDADVQEGIVGIRDPLSMFFMMVFYLNTYSPNITWSKVLQQANDKASIKKNGSGSRTSFRQLDTTSLQTAAATRGLTKDTSPAAQVAALRAQVQQSVEQAKREAAAQAGQPNNQPQRTERDSIADSLIWPIQSMPVIAGGVNKSVQWSEGKETTTFAEPLVYSNKGASHIETSIEFQYAVGLGDLNAMTNDNGSQTDPWGVAEVMAMTYMALSLVYPFVSTNLIGAKSGTTPREQKEGAQFPIIFLRHYSLFPFLTPFVCKNVRIEPDEGQPLLFGSPEADGFGNSRKHDLSIPAVRQTMKITLDLISAHYYLPVFIAEQPSTDANDQAGNNNFDSQIQYQTSGKSYLDLGKSMLVKRL